MTDREALMAGIAADEQYHYSNFRTT